MKTFSTILLLSFLTCLTFVGAGCGDDGDNGIQKTDPAETEDSTSDDSPPPVTATTPDLEGRWSGQYGIVQSLDPQQQPISATIQQNGSTVVITTTLVGPGATLTGTIEPNGEMRMTDPFDGETWTTYFGPATDTRVQVADFLYDSELGAASPLQVIDLYR